MRAAAFEVRAKQHHPRHRRLQAAHHAQVDVARLVAAAFDVVLGQRQQGRRPPGGMVGKPAGLLTTSK